MKASKSIKKIQRKKRDRVDDMVSRVTKLYGPKIAAKRRAGEATRWTSESGRRASLLYWASKNVPETTTARIEKDALQLAKAAWPRSEERIRSMSSAIRESAKASLNQSQKSSTEKRA